MDPEYQHDQTFASTLAGIEELRNKHSEPDTDWLEWKRLLIKGMRSGERLEREFQGVKMELSKAARADVQARLINKVDLLEAAEKSRGYWGKRFVGGLLHSVIAALTGGIAVYITQHWK